MTRALVVLLAALLLVSGCAAAPRAAMAPSSPSVRRGVTAVSGRAESADRDADGIVDQADRAPDPGPAGAPSPAPGKPAPPPQEKPHDSAFLVYTASMTVAVVTVDASLSSVEQMAREAGGFLANRDDRSITIRVPRARFRETLARIEQLGTVLSRSIQVEDVTDEFLDVETRLRNARAIRDRLEALRKTAGVKEALELEKEISRITQEIELMEGKLKALRERIAYSTITVTMQPLSGGDLRGMPNVLPFGWLDGLGLAPLLNVHQ